MGEQKSGNRLIICSLSGKIETAIVTAGASDQE